MSTPDKAALREQLGAARRGRPAADIDRARRAVREHVLARAGEHRWRRVAGYVPLRTEPGSLELLAALIATGVEVLVPVLCPDRDLDWATWTGPDRTGPALGRSAIASVDAVLLPALAVDRLGTRLGRGGGSYDRALARVRAGMIRAALLYDDELLAQPLPRDPWDRPVTSVVAPRGWTDLSVPTATGAPASATDPTDGGPGGAGR